MSNTATAANAMEGLDASDTARVERRRRPRHLAIGHLHAIHCDLTAPSIDVDLRLLDESDCGFGAVCDSPLPPGSAIHVCTSPESDQWRTAVVVCCAPGWQGYRIGAAFTEPR